jgi:pimeloyl-ACP methyl ester carboxylesterase
MRRLWKFVFAVFLVVLPYAGKMPGGQAGPITARAALERLCLSQPAQAAWFSPNFLAQAPIQQVNGLLMQYMQALGPCKSVTIQPNQTYYVQFQRGLIRVDLLQLDTLGRIAAIDAGDPKLTKDRVAFEGFHVYFRCLGAGTPTVVFEAGLNASSDSWDGVVPTIARTTRVCFYDRPGTGGSDSRPGPRTSLTIAKQLHALLAQEGIKGPYVLVGHSIAGFHLRVFAGLYPAAVAGMVCVDCTHPDAGARSLAALGPAHPGESPAVVRLRKAIVDYGNIEFFDLPTSAAQVRATGSLGHIPLIVLTAGNHHYPAAVAVREEAAWRGMQEELAGLSSDSVHVLIPHSGHGIQDDAPRPVIFAVREVVAAARARHNLPSCAKTFPVVGGVCFPAL